MRITSSLFEAFLKCPTKCYLRSLGETGSGNEYAEWVRGQVESYGREAAWRLQEAVSEAERVVAPPVNENFKIAKWRLAVSIVACTPTRGPHEPRSSGRESAPSQFAGDQSRLTSAATVQNRDPRIAVSVDSSPSETREAQELESNLHAIERIPSEGRGKPAQFIPIRFIWRNKLTKDDKLLLAFDAFVLAQAIGRDIPVGKIIHGELRDCVRSSRGNEAQTALPVHDEMDEPQIGNSATPGQAEPRVTKVKTAALVGEVRKRAEKIAALLTSEKPPELVLNRHCPECEFRDRCRQKVIETDDLSLLAGMSAKERQKLRSKGIFTVTQLSYTFRPRRRPKRLRDKREKYHHSLKALAIREKKIHIVGSPELKLEGTPVYLDVEGLPDRDFYYLIGLRIGHGDTAVQHSLWADTVAGEGKIWRAFLALLETIEKPVLIHYGSYETRFLKEMKARHGSSADELVAGAAIASAINLVSVMFAKIYFPTLSNGLKEIGQWLGYKWQENRPSGSETIRWRQEWERSGVQSSKQSLFAYNSNDCAALALVANTVTHAGLQPRQQAAEEDSTLEVVHADDLESQDTMWPKFSSSVEGFEAINEAARWDYQRDRIYTRTDAELRSVRKRAKARLKGSVRISKEVTYGARRICPRCQKSGNQMSRTITKHLHDLRFTKSGVTGWVVKCCFQVFRCQHCMEFIPWPREFWERTKFGRNLAAFAVFEAIELCVPQRSITHTLNRLFGFQLNENVVPRFKASAAGYYETTRARILERMLNGNLIHADETRIVLKGKPAYVWVFATFREVVYFYSETREGTLLENLLKEFKGVVVSDFYAAYDSLPCPQQKCLIHLMRDLNDAVLDHPFDDEVGGIVKRFAQVLRGIVATIDRRGLKRHFLRKHGLEVERFYRHMRRTSYQSEAALKCKERFEKNREKLFTFLNHDGVPWNNNNVEHAIKAFARLRRAIEGLSTPKGIEEYLILLSVCQTCKYMGVDFLDFLRSGEKDIHAFAESRRRRGRRLPTREPQAPPADEPETQSP